MCVFAVEKKNPIKIKKKSSYAQNKHNNKITAARGILYMDDI